MGVFGKNNQLQIKAPLNLLFLSTTSTHRPALAQSHAHDLHAIPVHLGPHRDQLAVGGDDLVMDGSLHFPALPVLLGVGFAESVAIKERIDARTALRLGFVAGEDGTHHFAPVGLVHHIVGLLAAHLAVGGLVVARSVPHHPRVLTAPN